MALVPRFSISGGPFLVRSYAIAASEEWDVYDAVGLDGAAALAELSDASTDILGAGLGNVGNTTTGQSDADELRPYISALTTGKHEPVAIMTSSMVFETDDYNAVGTAAVGDVNENVDLEVVSGDWGINNGTSATANTPNFRIIDIERTRGTYFIVPNIIVVAAVFQWYDAVTA